MTIKSTYLIILALILLSSFTVVQKTTKTSNISLLTTETTFKAGSNITLKFSSFDNKKPLLYCSNSYGSTLITPVLNEKTLVYHFPNHISRKKGIVNWQITTENKYVSGQFTIRANLNVASIETYIGPPSIQAGGMDYTMLVVIPTDSLDNPLPDYTEVSAKYQFLESEYMDVIKTTHLIAHKNIYSEKESGRMLVSSECHNTNSKEFTVNVQPAIPTGFIISAKRPHKYADGNQLTTFETSIIKDNENNIVSDGTFVTFVITNNRGHILKTYGTTSRGVATAQMIHPDYNTEWQVKAFVIGMAESNTIVLNYDQAITDFEVAFSKNNREIAIGPLKSYMGQMIPDGLSITIQLYKNNTLMESMETTSFDGYGHFRLKSGRIKNDDYQIIIQAAGIEKEYKNKTLW